MSYSLVSLLFHRSEWNFCDNTQQTLMKEQTKVKPKKKRQKLRQPTKQPLSQPLHSSDIILEPGEIQEPLPTSRKKKSKTNRDNQQQEEGKEEGSKQLVKYIPRNVKSDIRRHYPNMLVNVFNGRDIDLLNEYFSHFCRPDCKFIFKRIRNGQPTESIQFTKVKEDLPTSWFNTLHLTPDGVLKITDALLTIRPDGTSRVEASGIFSGTVPLYFNSLPRNIFDAFHFVRDRFILLINLLKTLRGSFPESLALLNKIVMDNSKKDNKDTLVLISFSITAQASAELDVNGYSYFFDGLIDWNMELGKNLSIKILPQNSEFL